MKTVDGGLHWDTISPDLTGATPNATDKQGASTVANSKQRGFGVVSTIAPSPLNRDVIWAGSDTGLIHLTRDGGKNWKNVTPPGLSDWSDISLIEASHFDPAVAYAAVNRSRLDDETPYLYRTRDYGATLAANHRRHSGMLFLACGPRGSSACDCFLPELNSASTFRSTMVTTGSLCS